MSFTQLRHDYVLFGATGFTGEYVVEELANLNGGETWAVAGRDTKRVQAVLDRVAELTGKDLSHVPVIRADVSDENSLAEMARRAKVVINVVGPYRFYGEPVVRACVENGASHVDISGEPIFLEGMAAQYHEEAKKAGVYVVGACGFDSIPCDLGILFAKAQMPGDLTAAETVAEFVHPPGSGPINFGTYQSMVHGVANRGELGPIRRRLYPNRMPKQKFGPPKRSRVLSKLDDYGKWCLPFLGSDKAVTMRTTYYNYEHNNEQPIAHKAFMAVPSLLYGVGLVIWAVMFALLAQFNAGRKLLEAYPEALTFGGFSKKGPTRDQVKMRGFKYWIFGYGYKTKLPRDEQHTSPLELKTVVRVDGPDAAYPSTAKLILNSARTIVLEPEALPQGGGVYSPGACFGKTKIIERLNAAGVNFKVVQAPTAI